jgi:hypothetical protein
VSASKAQIANAATANETAHHPDAPFPSWVISSLPALDPVDQALNPALPFRLRSFLRGVLCHGIIEIVHPPQAIDQFDELGDWLDLMRRKLKRSVASDVPEGDSKPDA